MIHSWRNSKIKTKILVLLIFVCNLFCDAQNRLPTEHVPNITYNMSMQTSKAYISGLLRMQYTESEIRTVLVNEFGVSFMEFTYQPRKQKVKLHYVMDAMNKWYIKRTLRSDIKNIINTMQQGDTVYVNTKRDIQYHFILADSINYDTQR